MEVASFMKTNGGVALSRGGGFVSSFISSGVELL